MNHNHNQQIIKKILIIKIIYYIIMAGYIYEYLYNEDMIHAREQLKFYEDKLKNINNLDINDCNKSLRRRRINFIIYCIKYTYGI